jgi:tRNA threonylcarbamoyladenosine biosynthesis protein TsaB
MLILAMDASGDACSAALWRRGAVIARRYRPMTRGHAEALMPMVLDVMAEGAEALRGLDAVAVSVGPGAFTGLRIALAAARGIGLAAAIPVVGVTTFAAIAEAVPESERAGRNLIVLLDTKRGDMFVQRFPASRSPLDPPSIQTPELFVQSLGGEPSLLAGDGAALVQPHLVAPNLDVRLAAALGPADAANVAEVAARSIAAADAMPATPLYLRAPAVRSPAGTTANAIGRARD